MCGYIHSPFPNTAKTIAYYLSMFQAEGMGNSIAPSFNFNKLFSTLLVGK